MDNFFTKNFIYLNFILSLTLILISKMIYPSLNFFILFFSLLLFLIYYLQEIKKFSNKLYDIILIIFFIKVVLTFVIYEIGFNLNFEHGDIGGSDSISYFYSFNILFDILSNQILDFNLSKEGFLELIFLFYNIFIKFLVPEISLKNIAILNIFYIGFTSIIFFRIFSKLKIDPRITFIFILLLSIDFKLTFFGFFNLTENLVCFLLTVSFYQYVKINLNEINYSSLLLFFTTVLLILLIKFNFGIIITLFYFIHFLFRTIFKKLTKIKIIIIFLILSVPIVLSYWYFFYGPANLYSAIRAADVIRDPNSIGSFFQNLDVMKNPFYSILQLISGIVGIFPLYKYYTPFMELEKIAIVWFHIVFILSFLGIREMIFNKSITLNHFSIILFGLLHLIICAIASLGTLEFVRFSIFSQFIFLYFSSSFLVSEITKKLKLTLAIYLIITGFLHAIYFPLKIFIF